MQVAKDAKLVTHDVSPYANYPDASMHKIECHVMARSGDVFGSATLGKCTDKFGVSTGAISHNPDFTSILTACNTKLYSITHFESPQPATAYFSELEQNNKGMLSIKTPRRSIFPRTVACGSPVPARHLPRARTWARRSTSLTLVPSLPLTSMR